MGVRSASGPRRLDVTCNGFGDAGVLLLADSLRQRADWIRDALLEDVLLRRCNERDCAGGGRERSKPCISKRANIRTCNQMVQPAQQTGARQASCDLMASNDDCGDSNQLQELVLWPTRDPRHNSTPFEDAGWPISRQTACAMLCEQARLTTINKNLFVERGVVKVPPERY